MHQYDVRGRWAMVQDNGWTIQLLVEQDLPNEDYSRSERLRGTATGSPRQGRGRRSTAMTGSTRGDKFRLEITWDDGKVGEYRGEFNGGRLNGVTFDRSSPADQETWVVNDKVFRTW